MALAVALPILIIVRLGRAADFIIDCVFTVCAALLRLGEYDATLSQGAGAIGHDFSIGMTTIMASRCTGEDST